MAHLGHYIALEQAHLMPRARRVQAIRSRTNALDDVRARKKGRPAAVEREPPRRRNPDLRNQQEA
jgi:hypothetical protein